MPQKIPFGRLIEAFGLLFHDLKDAPRQPASRPTPESRKRIEDELQVTLPDSLIELASACPFYERGWFAGLGENYTSQFHILRLNEIFRGEGLGSDTVMFNHGYDGDCDCWDVTRCSGDGEHPIVYVSLDFDRRRPYGTEPLATSFHDYLETFCRDHLGRIRSRKRKRRARELLGIQPKNPPTG